MTRTAIVLAAGEGTRMKSCQPKVMHEILGHPLVWWSVRSAKDSGADRIYVVVGNGADQVRSLFANDPSVECIEQTERKGTGHAVQCVFEAVSIPEGTCAILYGDCPLLTAHTLTSLMNKVESELLSAAVLTMTPPDVQGYGRIAFDGQGQVQAIIEDKDCTEHERKTLLECNSGVYAFNSAHLKEHIFDLTNNNTQGEYYLTDLVAIFKHAQKQIHAVHACDYTELLGVNSRSQLAQATKLLQLRKNEELMTQGVTLIDPNLVWVDCDVQVGQDTILHPMTFLRGSTTIGSNCEIGPNSRLTNTTVGDSCVVDETIAIDAIIDDFATCGPRAYLRPQTHLCHHAKAGTHVEIKASTIGAHSKVPHLSYIGNTTMGERVNVGAGSITCNYDGKNKFSTTIGNDVFIGSDTMMVAPLTIEDGAVIGASSCITKDVPPHALAIERSAQHIVEGYATKKHTR